MIANPLTGSIENAVKIHVVNEFGTFRCISIVPLKLKKTQKNDIFELDQYLNILFKIILEKMFTFLMSSIPKSMIPENFYVFLVS